MEYLFNENILLPFFRFVNIFKTKTLKLCYFLPVFVNYKSGFKNNKPLKSYRS